MLVELARTENVACIAVGVNRHNRLHERLVGSVGIYLSHYAPCPVIQVPASARHDTSDEMEQTGFADALGPGDDGARAIAER
jgi:hypothetical protein